MQGLTARNAPLKMLPPGDTQRENYTDSTFQQTRRKDDDS